uniref:Uncharacterized protein n=1 Tax=Chenopodium quinoa TaxID=63459 RepID=A0A803LYC9_CHEQI
MIPSRNLSVEVWAWERFLTVGPKPVSVAHGLDSLGYNKLMQDENSSPCKANNLVKILQVILGDEKENGVCDVLEVQCLDLTIDDRICWLAMMVSALLAAKCGEKHRISDAIKTFHLPDSEFILDATLGYKFPIFIILQSEDEG